MATAITLTFPTGPLAGEKFDLTRPGRYVLGRAADCDLQLPPSPAFGDVSRHHCLLEVSPPAVRVRDLGSRNGTFVNGQSIGRRSPGEASGTAEDSPWHPLEQGDELRLGSTALRVAVAGEAGGERAHGAAGSGVAG